MMSTPVRYCQLVGAADDPAVFARIHQAVYANLKLGHWLIYPCEHAPLCRELSAEEQQELLDRFKQPPSGGTTRHRFQLRLENLLKRQLCDIFYDAVPVLPRGWTLGNIAAATAFQACTDLPVEELDKLLDDYDAGLDITTDFLEAE